MKSSTKTLLVKIIKCSDPYYWYCDNIGASYKVKEKKKYKEDYSVIRQPYLILKKDCKII